MYWVILFDLIRYFFFEVHVPWSENGELEDVKLELQQFTMRSQTSTSTYSSASAGSESSEPVVRRLMRHSSLETINTNITNADEFVWVDSHNRWEINYFFEDTWLICLNFVIYNWSFKPCFYFIPAVFISPKVNHLIITCLIVNEELLHVKNRGTIWEPIVWMQYHLHMSSIPRRCWSLISKVTRWW